MPADNGLREPCHHLHCTHKRIKGEHAIFFFYEGAHICNLSLLIVNSIAVEEWNTLQNLFNAWIILTHSSKFRSQTTTV